MILAAIILTIASVDSLRMAMVIEQVENTKTEQVGGDGERSRFQITRGVWEKYSRFPFRDASSLRPHCRAEALRVALRHIDYIKATLSATNLPVNAYNVALAWNAGITATLTGTASARKRDYAKRAENLYHEPTP